LEEEEKQEEEEKVEQEKGKETEQNRSFPTKFSTCEQISTTTIGSDTCPSAPSPNFV